MSKSTYKATGCLWVFMEAVCLVLFITFLIMKLSGIPLRWGLVFSPLIVGLGITVMIIVFLVLAIIIEGKNEVDNQQ